MLFSPAVPIFTSLRQTNYGVRHRVFFLSLAFFFTLEPAVVTAQPACPPGIQQRVMLLGDSWSHIMWNNLTYRDVFNQFGFADKTERGNNTAIGGTTARFWSQPANLAVIVNELQQNPSIDVVLMSIGGNDMLAGVSGNPSGWHTGLSAADEALLFDRIQADMQTIINAIKGVRPNIEIVFSGYDYINLAETVLSGNAAAVLLWANLGQPNPNQINSAFARFEQRKINMANSDPRVHYVHSFGLMQFIYGYPGIFPPYTVPAPGQQPPSFSPYPGGNPDYPTPPIALANNGSDAIHLSDEGYRHLAVNQTQSYFWNKFRGGPNATFKSEGFINDGWVTSNGNVGTGGVRVGDIGSSNLYRGIFSFYTAAIPDNATITGASLFLNRSSLTGSNPFTSGSLGVPMIDVKTGTFGAAGIEATDYFTAADAVDAGCFIGTAPNDGYTIRIDFKPSGFSKINKSGHTQFRVYFQNPSGFFNDYITFHNGNQQGLLAPYLDVFYTVPPLPATASVSGSATICPGESAQVNVSLTGAAPWIITWSDGLTENVSALQHTRTVAPAATTDFHIVLLSDMNGPGSATGSALITVLPAIEVSVTGLKTNYCVNSPVATLFASPPGGTWSGPGISGSTFNPAAAVSSTGGGLITLTYSGHYNGCDFAKHFPLLLDANPCSQNGSCDFSAASSGTVPCVGAGPVVTTYASSGRRWEFDELIPGKTYVASTCDNCGYDSHLMVRDASTQIFIAENDDACSVRSSVTFVAPPSGKVDVNLSGERTFNCNGYPCNPHNCRPFNCNPYNCNPYPCNCQTCYETCYRDELVYMTCYPDGIAFINGYWTSACIGACTFGFCWRMRYQVPYDCNPYQCNCQTCYETCYQTCYETCYDTCYQTCYDKCGKDNFIACDVKLVCTDCTVPAATIHASNLYPCEGEGVSFLAVIAGATCKTSFIWNFGADGIPNTSTAINPQNVRWATGGVKQVSFQVNEAGVGSQVYHLDISFNAKPSGGNLQGPSEACAGDTVRLTLENVQHATGYHWEFSGGYATGAGPFRDLAVFDADINYFVVTYNSVCEGDTFFGSIQSQPAPSVTISSQGSTSLCPGESATLESHAPGSVSLQWQFNEQDIPETGNVITVVQGGNYRVHAADVSGCSSYSNTISVITYPAPQGELTGSTTGCDGDTIVLHALYSNTSLFQWFDDGVPIHGANDSVLGVTMGGKFHVTASSGYCAETSGVIEVTFLPLPPQPDIVRHGSRLECPAAYAGYQWYLDGQPIAGADASHHTMQSSGYYELKVSGHNGCSVFAAAGCAAQLIGINTGWNTISGYIIPDSAGMDRVFNDIASSVIIVKNNTGQAFIPSYGINNIGNWNFKEGYKIKSRSHTGLLMGCSRANPQTPLHLNEGWNMIPYLRSSPMNAATALSSLGSNIIIVKNNAGAAYIPSFGINNIGNMIPGQGYQIKLSAPGILIYPY